ncbi:MAG: FAD-dependent oxidoreductase, partial [Candidatus Aminicenantales bacterium]
MFSSKDNRFDLIIVGGGAAGFAAAIKADSLDTNALMVNSGLPMGGTCVNVGCVPTKFLLEVARNFYQGKNNHFKSLKLSAEVDFTQVMEEKDQLVNMLRKSNYLDVLENLPNVTYKKGKARFLSEKKIEVDGEKYSADKFIISTGSSTKILPIEGLKEAGFLTNCTALELRTLPKTLLVIGGGPLGLEFAQIFSRFGSKVFIVEAMQRILPGTEPVISERLKKYLEEEGIKIFTDAKVKKVNAGKRKIVEIENKEGMVSLEIEEILLAAGVVGNSQNLGLEKLGI